MGDAQVAQVGHDRRGVAEGEAGVELQAVGRLGQRPAAASTARASSVSASESGSWRTSRQNDQWLLVSDRMTQSGLD